MTPTSALGRFAAVPPLSPDGDDAREWAERELADPVYRAAEPTAFDRIARAVADFLGGLFSQQPPEGVGPLLAVITTIVIVAVVVAALVVWGVPRARRRSRADTAGLFDVDDARSAAQLRGDAADAAARQDWNEAVVLRFRALARGLAERDAVDTSPGATVHAFARAAARTFPDASGALEEAARAFDDVRYLRRPGTADLYARVVEVDDALGRMRPREAEILRTAG